MGNTFWKAWRKEEIDGVKQVSIDLCKLEDGKNEVLIGTITIFENDDITVTADKNYITSEHLVFQKFIQDFLKSEKKFNIKGLYNKFAGVKKEDTIEKEATETTLKEADYTWEVILYKKDSLFLMCKENGKEIGRIYIYHSFDANNDYIKFTSENCTDELIQKKINELKLVREFSKHFGVTNYDISGYIDRVPEAYDKVVATLNLPKPSPKVDEDDNFDETSQLEKDTQAVKASLQTNLFEQFKKM